MPFVLEAVQRALAPAKPEIWNSDPGSHFTSPSVFVIGRVLVHSDSDVSTAYGLAKQIQLAPLNQKR